MSFSTLFVNTPKDWDILTMAVKALTRNTATDVRYVSSIEDLSADKSIVDIVVMQLSGKADYALEIYWKGMANLAEDAVGMYMANALGSPVIVSDESPAPRSWLLLSPNGIMEQIVMDIDQLDEHSIVDYKVAEAG